MCSARKLNFCQSFLALSSVEAYSCSRAGPVRNFVLSVLVFHPVSRGDGAVDKAVREKRVNFCFYKSPNFSQKDLKYLVYCNTNYILIILALCTVEASSCSRAGPVKSAVLSVLVFHPVSRGDGAVGGGGGEKRGMVSKHCKEWRYILL